MSAIIKHVAAMLESRWASDIETTWEDYAKIAIEAMETPTGPMLDAAILNDKQWSINALPRIEAAWRVMIRAALNESPRS